MSRFEKIRNTKYKGVTGLGLGKVFEMANEIYGKKLYRW